MNFGEKRKVKIFDLAAQKEIATLTKAFPSSSRDVNMNLTPSLAFDPTGRLLVTANDEERAPGELIVWDAATGKEHAKLPVYRGESVHAVAFSADSEKVAYAGTRNIKVFDLATKKEIKALPAGGDSHVQTLFFSPDGKRLLTVHDGAMAASMAMMNGLTGGNARKPGLAAVRVWDLATGKAKTLYQAKKLEDSCRLGALSADGKTFAAQIIKEAGYGGYGGGMKGPQSLCNIHLFDVETGKELAVLKGNVSGNFMSLGFSPDGRRLVAAVCDFTKQKGTREEFRLWERTDPEKSPAEPSMLPSK